jgi:hypothetical protein
MSGDLDVRERLVLLDSAQDVGRALAAVAPVSAQVLHQYGSALVVAAKDTVADDELASVLPGEARPQAVSAVSKTVRRKLDDTAALGVAALEMRSSERYRSAKASPIRR